MIGVDEVLGRLPAYEGKRELVTWRQSVNRLMTEIVKAHDEFRSHYTDIAEIFDTGDIYKTCQKLWDFCKYNLTYIEETEKEQSVRSPAGILQKGVGVDCKHYSLFIGGVLDAIKEYEIVENYQSDWDWCYRFACYDNTQIPCHVFVVVFDKNKEIWVDPVLSSFDRKKQPTYYIDKRSKMALVKLSGVSEVEEISQLVTDTSPRFITVDKQKAETNFLIMVNNDIFRLKELFRSNPEIYNGRFRQWYLDNGFDFAHLDLIVNQ